MSVVHDSRGQMSSKGGGRLLFHLLFLPICWSSDMMAGPHSSSLAMRRKLHAEEGGAARHKELSSLVMS